MMKIEIEAPYPTVTITPYAPESIGMQMGTTAPASAAYPGTNRAIFVPFVTLRPLTIYKMFAHNGNSVSGNIDVGIYDAVGKKLWSAGSTAQSGTSQLQWFTLGTPLTIGADLFYMAVALNNTTGHILRRSLASIECRGVGMFQDGGNFPLADVGSFTSISSGYVPIIGLSTYNV
jgi:hypothetical protein